MLSGGDVVWLEWLPGWLGGLRGHESELGGWMRSFSVKVLTQA